MPFEYWTESIVLILLFFVIILIPCVGVSIMGSKMIDQLGQFPSRAPVIHMSVLLKLSVLEIISFAMLLVFFRVFSDAVK